MAILHPLTSWKSPGVVVGQRAITPMRCRAQVLKIERPLGQRASKDPHLVVDTFPGKS